MNSKKIDALNILLILISLLIAILFPFKLFLFSYAFFGPLHYLTEINWLNENNYFIKSSKKWKVFYISLCLFISFIALTKSSIDILENSILYYILKDFSLLLIILILFSTSLIIFKKTLHIIASLFFSIILSIFLKTYANSAMIFLGLFIPTLIHVYLFTLLFMIYGAIKSKSQLGLFCSALLFLVLVLILFIDISDYEYELSQSIDNIFQLTSMPKIINFISDKFGEGHEFCFNDLSIIGIKTQIFIAFAYTYHYLNWFSKTSIIGWKKSLSNKKSFYIVCIWLTSIYLYLTDYQSGYIALFVLSLIHVLLEFPLNIVTIKEILLLTKYKHNKG